MDKETPTHQLREAARKTSLRVAINELLVIQSLYDVAYTHYTQHGEWDENIAGLIQENIDHLLRVLSSILTRVDNEDIPF